MWVEDKVLLLAYYLVLILDQFHNIGGISRELSTSCPLDCLRESIVNIRLLSSDGKYHVDGLLLNLGIDLGNRWVVQDG